MRIGAGRPFLLMSAYRMSHHGTRKPGPHAVVSTVRPVRASSRLMYIVQSHGWAKGVSFPPVAVTRGAAHAGIGPNVCRCVHLHRRGVRDRSFLRVSLSPRETAVRVGHAPSQSRQSGIRHDCSRLLDAFGQFVRSFVQPGWRSGMVICRNHHAQPPRRTR